jgi:hypothetical protein
MGASAAQAPGSVPGAPSIDLAVRRSRCSAGMGSASLRQPGVLAGWSYAPLIPPSTTAARLRAISQLLTCSCCVA